MKIGITGANGFIGRHVLAEALQQGHEVLAIVRHIKTLSECEEFKIKFFECDLLSPDRLAQAISGCQAVIHLAAVMTGMNQYNATMKITSNLLKAMVKADVNTLVAFSSIAVLDYASTKPFTEIDESITLASKSSALGPYAKMKRDQENLMQKWHGGQRRLVILRPGIVYDNGTISKDHAGFKSIAVNHTGEVPVTHVKSVASAAVLALDKGPNHAVYHIVNDTLPVQGEYLQCLKDRKEIGFTFNISWRTYSLLTGCLRLPLLVLGECPDAIRINSVAARQRPYRFVNHRAKLQLDWQPMSGLEV